MTLSKSTLKEQNERPKLQLTQTSKLYLFVMVAVALSGLSAFLTFVNVLYTRQITKKQFPSLVQTASGETIEIGFEDPAYRSPEVIQAFVADTLYHLMTMTSYGAGGAEVSSLNPNRQKAAPVKVKVGGTNTGAITQTAWLASEALESRFADEFRSKLAEMTPPDVFTGAEEIILKIDYLKEPVAVENDRGRWLGEWTVDVVANMKVYRLGSGEVKTIPFNKRVTVRPIAAPVIHDVEQFGELAIALNASQRSGLQIINIKDIRLADSF